MKRFTSKLLTGISVTLIASSILAGCSKQNAASKVKAPEGWHLVWNDEFNGKEIDLTKWDFQLGTGSQYGLEGWGNNELQYYRKENASVKDGNLVLEARKEDFGGCAYTSARLRTVKDDGTELFTKTYGRIEARIKMPTGNGIWPAFWLLINPARCNVARCADTVDWDKPQRWSICPAQMPYSWLCSCSGNCTFGSFSQLRMSRRTGCARAFIISSRSMDMAGARCLETLYRDEANLKSLYPDMPI